MSLAEYHPYNFNLSPMRVRDRAGVLRTVRRTTPGQAQDYLEHHQRESHTEPYVGKDDPNCNACRELRQRLEEAQ